MPNNFYLIAGFAFIFLMTVLGSSVVFFFKGEISPKVNALFLGFASGIMIAASIWSLLLPAIAQAEQSWGNLAIVPVIIGFIVGGVILVLLDALAKRMHKNKTQSKSTRLFLSVTLHNIPEGLAVGFAFGVAALAGTTAAYIAAFGFAFGIGIQNFPEGAAVSLPIKSEYGNKKAFLLGATSGIAEPLSAIVGYFLASILQVLQPWLLSFSAGAMVFVAAQDLIPDSRISDTSRLGAWGVLIGFAVMMALDVALG